MKTSDTWNFRSIAGKIMMGLALATMIGSMEVAPAIAGDKDNRGGNRNGRENQRYEHRGHGHDRDGYQDRRVYRSYNYVEPVYVAPPVHYAPEPAPGISIFLPSIHIR